MIGDMPYKVLNAINFNLPLHFMTNLRREPGAIFSFLLISFTMTLTMSMLFRGVASVSRTLEQALAPAGLAILALVIYTGFVIPTTYMLGWARWINYINQVAYGFEALMINEFSGRTYRCPTEQLLPPYPGASVENQICSTVGAQPGQSLIEGSTFLQQSYDYDPSHCWRNYGIIWAFLICLMMFHIHTTEFISAKKSKGEVLVWRRGHVPLSFKNHKDDIEAPSTGDGLQMEMEEYADAVVGVPGEGLNVEQRKRLTIGVEIAAKPQLLLFLDEPTSGLDSQTSWSILNLLERLANNGQAILCTIHQPSAVLFQRFDRLLFLAKDGKSIYIGPIGKYSSILTTYFERNGANSCPPDANPAEWILEVVGAAPGSYSEIDWPSTWRSSPEYIEVLRGLETPKNERSKLESKAESTDRASYCEFAALFGL